MTEVRAHLPPLSRPMSWALGVGVFGIVLCGIGLTLAPLRTGPAWLAAFVFAAGFPTGALALRALDRIAGGPWGAVLRPVLTAMMATLPVVALAAIPILIAAKSLFLWAGTASPQHTAYLNLPFFILRTVAYFAIWGWLALRPLRAATAAAALILLTFTLSFAAIDWIMSLEAPWSSSVFGLWVSAGWLTAALAGAALLATRRGASAKELHAIGTMLFTGVLIIAYLGFMQFLIIWEENLTREIGWYLRRFAAPWNAFLAGWVVIGLIMPFFLLLSRRVKESAGGIALSSVLILIGQLLAIWWLVLPAFSYRFDWTAPVSVVAIVSFGVAAFIYRSDTP